MTDILIILAAAAVAFVLLASLFKALWKVPNADEALIVTGFGVKAAPAGPAMKMAKDALGTTNGAAPPDKTP